MLEVAPGLRYYPDFYSRDDQGAIVASLRGIVQQAPLFTPRMPRTGKAFSVRMTNCGSLGWVSDAERGYRYEPVHPLTGKVWPEIPDLVLRAWRGTEAFGALPEACLVNFYDSAARMGLHQDSDEQALDAPVVSISLGSDCLFRFGGATRGGKTQSMRLHSGDVLLIGGDSRLCFHGVDRIYPGTSQLVADGGRINLTMRRVTLPCSV